MIHLQYLHQIEQEIQNRNFKLFVLCHSAFQINKQTKIMVNVEVKKEEMHTFLVLKDI